MKTIDEINEKIAREEAIILTAAELKSIVRDGQTITARRCGCSYYRNIWRDVRYYGSYDGTCCGKM